MTSMYATTQKSARDTDSIRDRAHVRGSFAVFDEVATN